jgi:hypothetical protein
VAFAIFGAVFDAALPLAACLAGGAFGSRFAGSPVSGFAEGTGVVAATAGSLLSAGLSGTVGAVGCVVDGEVGLGDGVAGGAAGATGVGGVGVACAIVGVDGGAPVGDRFDAVVDLGGAFIASRMYGTATAPTTPRTMRTSTARNHVAAKMERGVASSYRSSGPELRSL